MSRRAACRPRPDAPRGPAPAAAAALAAALVAALAAGAVLPGAVAAQRSEPTPEELAGVGVDERPGALLPLQAPFVDSSGDTVTLGRYFDGERPVILTLVYFRCPMLCPLILDGLTDALRRMKWRPGRDFGIVTISFDPTETATLARLKRQEYLEKLGRPSAGDWHFLTGSPASIAAVTDSVGFRYRWNDETDQFAHPAVIVVATPDGRVARYLYGIDFAPQTVRLSLVEASEGEVGSTLDRVLLFCFHYDSDEGRYAPAARNLMKAGGALTVLLLGGILAFLWRRDRRRRGSPGKAA